MSRCPNSPRTYFVISPEIKLHPGAPEIGLDPPEYGCAVMEVRADNKREAVAYAIRHPNREFEKWIDETRGDGRNPFAGVLAEHYHCDHGTCIDDEPDDPDVGGGCTECAREDEMEGAQA